MVQFIKEVYTEHPGWLLFIAIVLLGLVVLIVIKIVLINVTVKEWHWGPFVFFDGKKKKEAEPDESINVSNELTKERPNGLSKEVNTVPENVDFAEKLFPKGELKNHLFHSIVEGEWKGEGEDLDLSLHFNESGKVKYSYKIKVNINFIHDRISFKGQVSVFSLHSNLIKWGNLDFNAVGFMVIDKANIIYSIIGDHVLGTGSMNFKFTREGTAVGYFISDRISSEGRGFGSFKLEKVV